MLFDYIIRKSIKDHNDIKDKAVREKYGYLGGIVGILVNVMLFAIKFSVGFIINSIAVTADAFNNLSDVGSSVVTIFGFKLAGKPADKEHPFGHGRIEYISALVVATLVLLVGFEFIKISFNKILHPTPVDFSWVPFILLLVSVLFKIWLGIFYRKIGNKIGSNALKASGVDAFSDVISSLSVVLSLILSTFIKFPLDGYIGLFISGVILFSGYKLIKDTISPLLGSAPDAGLVEDIQQMLLEYEGIYGVHDLMVHNYGPGRTIASIHAEVPLDIPIVKIHEVIDRAEKEISSKLDIFLVIHMDPVTTDDREILDAKDTLTEALKNVPTVLSFHDFRVVGEGENKNLIFDVVVGAENVISKEFEIRLQKEINIHLKKLHPNYNAIITVDKDYIGVV